MAEASHDLDAPHDAMTQARVGYACADNADIPSPDSVRPWGLRGMKVPPSTGRQIRMWRYDHESQMAWTVTEHH
ncbi:MAG: hypothetical protein JO063_08225 [Pseudonocardiales bacterium]|nr:hypothetical protein [Pseudonocardiales bacterium]